MLKFIGAFNNTVTLALAICLLVGCQDSASDSQIEPTYEVTGTVSYDGNVVPDGTIQFTSPEDIARGSASSASIVDGKYTALVTTGKKQVKIYSPQPTGPADETGSVPLKETIPSKYNDKTTLESEIPAASFEADFDLVK